MTVRQDRGGLGRYGVAPAPVVRTPARNPDGTVICPECGADITASKQGQPVSSPDLADAELHEAHDGDLLVFGWRCTRHQYDVVCPAACHGQDAENLRDGWTGVRLVFADQQARWVATPQQELPEVATEYSR